MATSTSVSVIRIKPNHYIHVVDNNTNVTRVEIGPKTFSRLDHERVINANPEPMIMIPPRHYAIIDNPTVKNPATKKPELDQYGQVRLRHGDQEIRFSQEPFPLYPGEVLSGKPTPLQVVQANHALRLRGIRDFEEVIGDPASKDAKVIKRLAGDEWLFEGPATYFPRVEVQVVEVVKAIIIKDNQALKLRARQACIDKKGVARAAGEEWLIRESGAYLPGVFEEVVGGIIPAQVLTEKVALHLLATKTFTDVFGKKRKAGEEWLVSIRDADTHIPDVYEQVVGVVNATTLTSRQFCVIVDPVGADGKNRLGHRELRKGECTFFLRPGEKLEKGIQNIYVLGEEEALLLKAKVAFDETIDKDKKLRRRAGDRWMIYGPCDYIPSIEIEVVERRTAIPLDSNEGIYVRDIAVGTVRAVVGQSYMLKPTEELWAKELPKSVEDLLMKSTSRDQNEGASHDQERDPTRVISYRVPHNAAVQIYDFKQKKARVVFGPELVMLGPEEQFTVLNLSGGVPKRPNYIKSLALFLGPDFMTDLITVETADHARLSLKLSYNWHFDIPDRTNQAEASKIFSTPDFTGDLCKAIGSLVRGAVAASSFDEFHKHSADIIHSAVFGKSNDRLLFPGNNLYVTNIDVQSVEPVDQRTLDSLQKSVQLAIEITTKSQEAAARQEAERLEQEARGRLERQRISDEAEAEKARRRLLELQAASAAVESTGQASAEARAHAEAALIEGQAEVNQAKLTSEALTIQAAAELEQLKLRQESEIAHAKALAELEISKARELAEIEAEKFKSLVDAIGADTITHIARAGPEMQAKLLQGLGLKSFMITDGKSPINLFGTAGGLIGGAGMPGVNVDTGSDTASNI
jgi:major vault protein